MQFVFYTILFYLQTISSTLQAGKRRIERWCDWDVLNTAELLYLFTLLFHLPKKVGRRMQDFDIWQEILRICSISSTVANEGIQRHPPCSHSAGSTLSHVRAGIEAMAVLACPILVQRSSWYFLQLLKMPRTFCLNGLYLLIFAVLKIKIEKFKKIISFQVTESHVTC